MTAPLSSWSRERARLLGEEHKVRLGMFFFLTIFLLLRPEVMTHVPAAMAALGLCLATTLLCIFGVRIRRSAAASAFELSATAVAVVDLVSITLLVYGTGGAASQLYLIYAVPLIFAGAFFRRGELALLTGLTCAFYGLLFMSTAGAALPASVLALRLGGLMLVVWQAYALTLVLHREKQGNDQLLRHLAEGVVVLDDQRQVVLVNQALSSMFAVGTHDLEGSGAADIAGGNETLRWVLEDVLSPHATTQGTTRIGHFPEQDLPMLEVTTIFCHEHSGQSGGWVVVCRDLRDARGTGHDELFTECDEVSPLANLRALSQTLYGLTERLDESDRWRAVSLIEQHTEAMKTILSRLLRHDGVEDEVADLDRVNVWGLLSSTRRILEVRDRLLDVTVDVDCSNELPAVEAERGALGRLVLAVARELLGLAHPLDRLVLGGKLESGRMVVTAELCPSDKNAPALCPLEAAGAVEMNLRRRMTELSRLFVQCGSLWRIKRTTPGYCQVQLSIPLQRAVVLQAEEAVAQAPLTMAPAEGLDLLSQGTFSKLNNVLGVIRGRAELALMSRQDKFVELALLAAVTKTDKLCEMLEQIVAGPRGPVLERVPEPRLLPATPAPTAGSVYPLPVLIVDDEEGVRELLVQMFEAFGCDATATSGAQEAIDYLQENRPGLALVDLIMPGANGVDVLNRAREMYPDLPVVMMSGAGSAGIGAVLGDHQPTAVLAKPFSVTDVQDLARQMQQAAAV